jgi:polyisoprenoid-binding protein YceI
VRHHPCRLWGVAEIKNILLSLVILLFAGFAHGAPYTIDSANSVVEFTWSYGGLSDDTGRVKAIHGVVNLNEATPEESDVHVTIPASSLTTDDASNETLLKGDGFFDVTRHPTITFQSDSISVQNLEQGQMGGRLTMRGITKPITLDVQFSKTDFDALRAHQKDDITFKAQTVISRSTFEMDDYTGFIADSVAISITAHLKKVPR